MKALQALSTAMTAFMFTATTLASEAETSATAGSSRYERNGTAAATARYEGDVGFARTNTRSGRINTARGVAVGVDEDGLSLSVSQAIATRRGPALATNFNLSIGRDGSVSSSRGISRADGPFERSATAGGSTGTGPYRDDAISYASGRTDRFGHVQARTRAENFRRRDLPVRRPRHARPATFRNTRSRRPLFP